MRKVLFYGIWAISLLFTSCKEEEKTVSETKTQMLSKTWKVTKLEIENPANVWGDSTNTLPACEADDRWVININGTWTKTPGANLCVPGQLPTTGSWKLQNDEKEFVNTISFLGVPGKDTASFTVNSTTLVYIQGKTPERTRYTYTKQ